MNLNTTSNAKSVVYNYLHLVRLFDNKSVLLLFQYHDTEIQLFDIFILHSVDWNRRSIKKLQHSFQSTIGCAER